MTKIEALELELAARKMVEGTELGWWEVVRRDYMSVKSAFSNPPQLELYQLSLMELALGIIEGKPVWKGNEAYCGGEKVTVHSKTCFNFRKEWSWNPPTPKTVMVELTVEDARMYTTHLSQILGLNCADSRLVSACRKALETVK